MYLVRLKDTQPSDKDCDTDAPRAWHKRPRSLTRKRALKAVMNDARKASLSWPMKMSSTQMSMMMVPSLPTYLNM